MANAKISQLAGASTPLSGSELLPIVQSSTTKNVSVANLTAGRDIATKQITSTVSGATTALDGWSLGNGTANAIFKLSGATYAYRGVGSNYVWIGGDGSPMYIGTSTSQPVRLGTNAFQNFTLETDGNMSVNNAGNGFNFTANTGAAGKTSQLLNWYEEGTFTPALTFGGGSTGIGYDNRTGYYTRIGRQVFYNLNILLNNKGSSTGDAVVTGLPFVALNSTALFPDGILRAVTALTFTAPLYAQVNKGASTIGLLNNSGGSQAALTNTAFANNTEIAINGFYFV